MNHSALVTCHIFIMSYKPGTNMTNGGFVFKIEKIFENIKKFNDTFIVVDDRPCKLVIDNMGPSFDTTYKFRAVTHPVLLLVSNKDDQDELDMNKNFDKLKDGVESEGWTVSKVILEYCDECE